MASDGQVTVMQAIPTGAGSQQVQVPFFSQICMEKYCTRHTRKFIEK